VIELENGVTELQRYRNYVNCNNGSCLDSIMKTMPGDLDWGGLILHEPVVKGLRP